MVLSINEQLVSKQDEVEQHITQNTLVKVSVAGWKELAALTGMQVQHADLDPAQSCIEAVPKMSHARASCCLLLNNADCHLQHCTSLHNTEHCQQPSARL